MDSIARFARVFGGARMMGLVMGAVCSGLFGSCLGGCGEIYFCDPYGTFVVDIDWATGAGPLGHCGIADPVAQMFDIRASGEGEFDVTGAGGRSLDGKLTKCTLDFSYIEVEPDGRSSKLYAMSLDALEPGHLTGSGVMTVSTPASSCDQTFVVTGMRLEPFEEP